VAGGLIAPEKQRKVFPVKHLTFFKRNRVLSGFGPEPDN
jgi:hypothetical protein